MFSFCQRITILDGKLELIDLLTYDNFLYVLKTKELKKQYPFGVNLVTNDETKKLKKKVRELKKR